MRRLALALLATLAAAMLTPAAHASAKPLPDLTPAGADALSRALSAGRLDEATYALERARALLRPAAAAARWGSLAAPAGRDATMILRDLVLRLDQLAPAQRALARRLLARPKLKRKKCGTRLCVHWARSGPNAASRTYRDRVLTTFGTVWDREVKRMGFRRPRPDGDRRVDVYVLDIGRPPLNLYGYCVPIAKPRKYPYWDRAAYCVVDNNYSRRQYPPPGAHGVAALRVTAAHEFFHAVQFAYDFAEDLWMMESTATWIEDELYDGVDDNRQYLERRSRNSGSPLSRPAIPLDYGADFGVYGTWIFWRYLTEVRAPGLFPNSWGPVRASWARAAGTRGAPDDYSTQAIANALKPTGAVFKQVFADFGAANRHPADTYSEGAAYPVPPDVEETALAVPVTSPGFSVIVDHLATRYHSFVPDPGNPGGTTIELTVDAPPGIGLVTLVVESAVGNAPDYVPVPLDALGHGSATAPFDAAAVARVTLAATNAGRTFRCWTGRPYSCAGTPQQDDQPFLYSATTQ